MLRIPWSVRATAFALVCCCSAILSPAADPAPAPAGAPPPPTLIGLAREDVIVLRGKPTGERQSGDRHIMVYADGTRVELRGGVVVAVTGGGPAGEIVGADGKRYVPGPDGNIQRPVQVSDPAAPPGEGPAGTATSADEAEETEDQLPPGATPPPAVDGVKPAAAPAESSEDDELDEAWDVGEEEEMSPTKKLLTFGVAAVLRFGFTVLVLRLALHFVGVPCLWPDLLKVSLLYLAVREVMHSLGELGGYWEFVPLFRIDDLVSFVVLACSLTWFKIAGSGLTALKVAAMAKVVIVVLMYAVMLALTFGLSGLE